MTENSCWKKDIEKIQTNKDKVFFPANIALRAGVKSLIGKVSFILQ